MALLAIIGLALALALIVATIVDKDRQPIHDTFRVALGIAVAGAMVHSLVFTVSA